MIDGQASRPRAGGGFPAHCDLIFLPREKIPRIWLRPGRLRELLIWLEMAGGIGTGCLRMI